MSELSLLLEGVAELARLTGDVAQRYFGANVAVEWKQDGSPVTVADRAAETAAREWIERRFPGDGIVGEEMGVVERGTRRWVIDPIDGTKSFIRGVPLWGSLVALVEGNDVLAGAAYFPAVNELLCAAPDEGCWWNGRRAHVSAVDTLSRATVLTTDERFTAAPRRAGAWQALANRAGLSRSWGDCYGYLLVATGRAEAMVDGQLSMWDAAALLPCVTEAGGVFTDWSGKPTAFGGSAIATNVALAAEVRDILTAGTR